MLACRVTPKDNDKTSKGWQDVIYIYYGGNGIISNDFQNINTKAATKHLLSKLK
jgi:hypothetical protein